MNQQTVIEASELTKGYGQDAGVFEMDLELAAGMIVGLIGPSGSGKTTTVRLMTGVTAPDAGWVKVLGENPTRFKPETRARLGYMPQLSVLYPDLTLRENLNFAASLYGMPYRRRESLRRVIDLVELEGAIDRMPRDTSGGEKRRVMLAATLVHEPDLIFLDEPTAGIDPVLRRKFWDRFTDLAEQGRTLFVTTQYVGEAAYCDYVAVLANGRILTYGTPEQLRATAYGGEMIEVVFVNRPEANHIASLKELTGGKPMEWLDARSVRLVVTDAGTAAPSISEWARAQHLDLEKTEAYLPPFDDVFVELVSKLERGSEDQDGS